MTLKEKPINWTIVELKSLNSDFISINPDTINWTIVELKYVEVFFI